MQTLNFNSRQIISKEELILWDQSLRDLPAKVFKYLTINGGVGILDRFSDSGFLEEGFFRTIVGSVPSGGFDTIQIQEGWGVLKVDTLSYNIIPGLITNNDSIRKSGLALFYWPDTDNIDANIGSYSEGAVVSVGFAPVMNPMELGECSITSSNQVTIVDGDFNKLRDQTFKNPTKVRFYNEDGSAADNNQIYEVVQKVNSTQMVISGVTTVEANVRMVVVGSYDFGVYGDLEDKMAFPTITGQLVLTTNEEDIINAGGFVVSELRIGAGGTFTIEDLRENNIFNFAPSPDSMYKSRDEIVTGQKDFQESSPIFNVPVIEGLESTSHILPLEIPTYSEDPYDNILTIPDGLLGSVFTVRATSLKQFIGRLVCETEPEPGTKLYIRVDEGGVDLKITSVIGNPWVIRANNGGNEFISGSWAGMTIKKGSILELLLDEDNVWRIINSDPISPTHTWAVASGLSDGAAIAVPPTDFDIFYKVDKGVVYLQMNFLSSTVSPVLFQLPDNCIPAYRVGMNNLSTSGAGSVSVSPTGVVSIEFPSALGNIYKQLIYHV